LAACSAPARQAIQVPGLAERTAAVFGENRSISADTNGVRFFDLDHGSALAR
jgi:hypothetical protein